MEATDATFNDVFKRGWKLMATYICAQTTWHVCCNFVWVSRTTQARKAYPDLLV